MGWPGRGGRTVIGIVIAVIIGIILLGIFLKLLKVAIILALAIGIVMVAQNAFGNKRLK